MFVSDHPETLTARSTRPEFPNTLLLISMKVGENNARPPPIGVIVFFNLRKAFEAKYVKYVQWYACAHHTNTSYKNNKKAKKDIILSA